LIPKILVIPFSLEPDSARLVSLDSCP
jgi:hypothetical protein